MRADRRRVEEFVALLEEQWRASEQSLRKRLRWPRPARVRIERPSWPDYEPSYYRLLSTNGEGEPWVLYYVTEEGAIFGATTAPRINRRKPFGTLDTLDQFDWRTCPPRPLPGSQARMDHDVRKEKARAKDKRRKERKEGQKPLT
jgi:hypothetical protein